LQLEVFSNIFSSPFARQVTKRVSGKES